MISLLFPCSATAHHFHTHQSPSIAPCSFDLSQRGQHSLSTEIYPSRASIDCAKTAPVDYFWTISDLSRPSVWFSFSARFFFVNFPSGFVQWNMYDNPQSVSQRTLSCSRVVAEMINVLLLLQLP